MAVDSNKMSGAESLRKTRTFGKVRCHNPTCMGRLEPEPGAKEVQCPVCKSQFRLAWVNKDLPRIRGPVWEVNKKLAEEAFKKKMEGK